MARPNQGPLLDRILNALQEAGASSSSDIAITLGVNKYLVHATLRRLRTPTKTLPQRVYISEWVYDQERERNYWRPIYMLGCAPNADRPKADVKAVKRRYEARQRLRANSVFEWGVHPRKRAEVRRALP